MHELTNEHIIVKPQQTQLTVFDKYVLYVKEHTTELSCHHGRFYWHTCVACRRDAKHASDYQKYYTNKIHKVLSAISPE